MVDIVLLVIISYECNDLMMLGDYLMMNIYLMKKVVEL